MSRPSLLAQVSRGSQFRLEQIGDQDLEFQLLRAGFGIGALVRCLFQVPGGPVIIQHHRTRFAVGRDLAEQIVVELEL